MLLLASPAAAAVSEGHISAQIPAKRIPALETDFPVELIDEAVVEKSEERPELAAYKRAFSVNMNKKKNWRTERRKFHEEADGGDKDAMWKLGYMYLTGKGKTPVNETKATEYFMQAARLGQTDAQFWLAECYAKGQGVAQSNQEAVRWYKKAAENGNVAAKTSWAVAQFHGIGTEKNEEEAIRHFTQAADAGNARAQYELAKIYRNGLGSTEKDASKADKLLLKAAENGWVAAKTDIAKREIGWLLEGKPKTELTDKSYKWLKESALSRDPVSLYLLAWCEKKGFFGPASQSKALELYEQAASR
ncbi:MAG: sel1 repeat family protein, partial [Thermoguttaceae bacterium]|nr:sel1 repeat family protein [Thermoguttaceae bacterium]